MTPWRVLSAIVLLGAFVGAFVPVVSNAEGISPRADVDSSAILAVSPSYIPFGYRFLGSPPLEGSVTFSNPGLTPYHVLTLTSSNPKFEILTPAPVTVVPGVPVEMRVRYFSAVLSNDVAYAVYTTDVPNRPGPYGINFYGQTVVEGGTAVVYYQELDLGEGRQWVSEDIVLRVHNESLAPLTIHSATLGGTDFQLVGWPGSAVVAGGGNTWYGLTIRFPRTAVGSFADTLHLTTSDPANPEIDVRILGSVIANPGATVDAAAIEPLDLVAGTSTSRSVVVGNTGPDAPLAVSASIVIDAIAWDPAAVTPPGDDAHGDSTVPLPQFRLDGAGHPWNVLGDGAIGEGEPAAFDFALRRQGFTAQAQAEVEDAGRTLRLRLPTPGILHEREVHVSPSGPYVRYLDTIENGNATTLNASLVFDTQLRIDTFLLTLTSAGGGTFDPNDDWVIVHDEQAPDVVHVLAGPGGALRPAQTTLTNGNRNVRYVYNFALAPGAVGSILHYVVQAADLTEAQAVAEALRRPSGDALAGLSAAERSHILNFAMAGTFRLPTTSWLIPPGGTAQVPVVHDAIAAAMDVTTTGSLRLTTDDPLQPLFVVPLSLHVTGVPVVLDAEGPDVGPALALTARFVPNPAVGRSLRLAYALPTVGEARFELYDVRGRRIASHVLPEAVAGPGTLDWSGGAGGGDAALAPGVYWTRLTHGGRSVVTKGVVLR